MKQNMININIIVYMSNKMSPKADSNLFGHYTILPVE
jgi:hypothetical protein